MVNETTLPDGDDDGKEKDISIGLIIGIAILIAAGISIFLLAGRYRNDRVETRIDVRDDALDDIIKDEDLDDT